MALVLGMHVDGDNKIFLNDLKVTVDQIISPTQVKITIHGACLEEKKVLNDKTYTKITGQVKMMLGIPSDNQENPDLPDFCRVMIEAPRSIKILRGKLKEEQ